MPTKPKHSLKSVVGNETYTVWVAMLQSLVPSGRTHRLSVVVAAMLQYATNIADEKIKGELKANPLAEALIEATEADPETIKELLHASVTQLFKDAGASYKRTSARGEAYTITDSIYEEYFAWFNMPWE